MMLMCVTSAPKRRCARFVASRALTVFGRRGCGTAKPIPAVEKPARWPLAVGGVTVVCVLAGGVVFQQDAVVRRLHPRVQDLPTTAVSVLDGGGGHLFTLLLAHSLAGVPVDDFKRKIFQLGALDYWCAVLRHCAAWNQDALAISGLNEVLAGEAAFEAFRADSRWYGVVVNGLLPLLKPHDVAESVCTLSMDPEAKLLDVVALGATLAAHPAFLSARGEERLWDAVLQAGVSLAETRPDILLPWSALAAAAAQRKPLARTMLFDRRLKLLLLQCAEEPADAADSDAPIALRRNYARAALTRLAHVAEAEGAPRISLGWDRFLDEFVTDEVPELPARPPVETMPEDSPVQSVAVCAFTGGLWGALRGLRKSVRTARPVWRTSLNSAAGALALETVMQLKVRYGPVSQNYPSVAAAAGGYAVDLVISFGLLWALMQPGRAPYTFGGWMLGQAILITTHLAEHGA